MIRCQSCAVGGGSKTFGLFDSINGGLITKVGDTRGKTYCKSGDSGIFCMVNAMFELMNCQKMASLLWEIMRWGDWREI